MAGNSKKATWEFSPRRTEQARERRPCYRQSGVFFEICSRREAGPSIKFPCWERLQVLYAATRCLRCLAVDCRVRSTGTWLLLLLLWGEKGLGVGVVRKINSVLRAAALNRGRGHYCTIDSVASSRAIIEIAFIARSRQ